MNRSARELCVMVVLPAAIQCSSPTGARVTWTLLEGQTVFQRP